MERLFYHIRYYFYKKNLLYAIKIFIALTGTTLGPWLLDVPIMTIPLTLGVVAAALTDLDDSLAGRLVNIIITLLSFAIASASIELLMPYPWLFALGLFTSTCGFILLGAFGQRYATIAFGALLIAIYTMLGASLYDEWYIQPILLLCGAIWYYMLTLIGHIILPIRPLQSNVSQCFIKLADYFDAKATLFDPDEENGFKQQFVDIAMANSELIKILNETKTSLMNRLKGDRGQKSTRQLLHYYFIAQEIHEQISSSHVRYQSASNEFRYSDVLFRFQKLLFLQAKACRAIGHSILFRDKYIHNDKLEDAFQRLENTLNHLKARETSPLHLVNSLQTLLMNLGGISRQLASLQNPVTPISNKESGLQEERLRGIREVITHFFFQFTPKSPLFRHAIRMAVVLCVGYAIIQIADLQRGYWILLTSLFVCQPNYSATKNRLFFRILGTLVGIALGIPVLYFVPSQEGQLVLIVITGVLFFVFRAIRYAQATMFITLLVLLSFNILGEGYEVIIPRIIDTVIGCFIAWAAVTLIWPDWKFRQLPTMLDKVIEANAQYFDAIKEQYYHGRNTGMTYQLARRDANNLDAELASIVANLSAEPKKDTAQLNLGFRLLGFHHNLLSYISALGAHREETNDETILKRLDECSTLLNHYAKQEQLDTILEEKQAIVTQLEQMEYPAGSKELFITQQLQLILNLLPELVSCKEELLKLYHKEDKKAEVSEQPTA